MIGEFGRSDAKSKAALEAFGDGLGSLDFDGELEVEYGDAAGQRASAAKAEAGGASSDEDTSPAEFELEPEPALEIDDDDTRPLTRPKAQEPAEPGEDRPNLEPIGEDAHPSANRRAPTQPPGALSLAIDDDGETRPYETVPEQSEPEQSEPEPSEPRPAPLPSTRGPSPSPVPVGRRRWLLSDDRITSILAGVAIGLALMIIPAKKLARGYEIREVEPMLADLDGAIDHPLGVEAGLVEKPQAIAARIEAGRTSTRRRYLAIWLLVGLPIGLGLGLAPRPGD